MDAVMDEVSLVMAIVLHIRTSAWLGWHEVSGYRMDGYRVYCVPIINILRCALVCLRVAANSSLSSISIFTLQFSHQKSILVQDRQ